MHDKRLGLLGVALYLINMMLPLACKAVGCLSGYMVFFNWNGAAAINFLIFIGLGYSLRPLPLLATLSALLVLHEWIADQEEARDIFLVHDRLPSTWVLPIMIPIVFVFSWGLGAVLRRLVAKRRSQPCP